MSTSRKSASAYRHKGHYFVHSNSRTDAGFWLACLPAQLLTFDVAADELGLALIEMLVASAERIQTPNPKDYPGLHSSLLKIAEVKSWQSLQRSAQLCNIWQTENDIEVEPTRNGGASGVNKGYEPIESQSTFLSAGSDPADLGVALIAAFERCC